MAGQDPRGGRQRPLDGNSFGSGNGPTGRPGFGNAGRPGAGSSNGPAGRPGNSGLPNRPGFSGGNGPIRPGFGSSSGPAGRPGTSGGNRPASRPGFGGGNGPAGRPGFSGGNGPAGRPGFGGGSRPAGRPGFGGGNGLSGRPGSPQDQRGGREFSRFQGSKPTPPAGPNSVTSVTRPSPKRPAVLNKFQGTDWNKFGPGGFRNFNDTIGPEICERPSLFRHPTDWDKLVEKYTLHVFPCPIVLGYDTGITACNWPFD